MIQYTSCADPLESTVRRERLRQFDQTGRLEESVAQMARVAVARQNNENPEQNPELIHTNSPERTSTLLRLGSPTPPGIPPERDLDTSPRRTPALLQLGKTISPPKDMPPPAPEVFRRKPGRPPGSRKVSNSRKTLAGASSRKRKVQQTKAPTCRRRIPTQTGIEAGVGPSRRKKGDSKEHSKQNAGRKPEPV
ncbi:hypothetical protein F2Q68_00045447 [Brassica cretica]|uniref:Uncharacterized protein n=1 Tax=Brassica cretica TaxID=69181 RepID=A0A8S9LRI5_BRACR|nr:hypothetical protein F2Q68_00045447 [Brassica cretica]